MTKLTFKDLKQQLAKLQSNTNQDNRLDVLRNKPFWIWNKQEHLKQAVESNQQCCFNYIVKCPTKGGKEYPLFDYEKLLYDTLLTIDGTFKDKHLFCLKSTLILNKFAYSVIQSYNTNRDIPEYFMVYDCGDVQKIERYCGSCLEKEKVRKYNYLP